MNAKPRRAVSLLLAPLLFASFHCGGRPKSQAATPRAQPANADQQGAMAVPDSDNICEGHAPREPKAQISQLWNEILDLRQAHGFSAELQQSELLRLHTMTVRELREASDHAPPKTQTCIDTCTLENSICSNAKRICLLAKELGNDDWATNMCDRGKVSCEEATKQCATCVSKEAI